MTAPHDWRDRTILAYLDEPPFCAPGRDGHPVGCDIAVAEHVLHAAGVRQVVFELAAFWELIPGLIGGRWHVSTPMFVTPERAAQIRYSRPVWAAVDGFIVRAGDERTYTSYEAIASHPGARLAVVVGQVQRETAIRAGVRTEQIVEFADQDAAAFAVKAGDADASAGTAPGSRAFIARAADPTIGAVADRPDRPRGGSTPCGAYSFHRDAVDLPTAFDRGLGRYLGTPAHLATMARHGFTRHDLAPVLEAG
jgi:polar amino acid transport system substrate-binding protein